MKLGDTDQREGKAEADGIDGRKLGLRARLAVLALGARSVLQVSIRIPALMYLARVLSPSDFGVFALLQFALSFLKMIGDGGLAAALLQKEAPPDQRQLSSVFWVQMGIATLLVALAWLVAPWVISSFASPDAAARLAAPGFASELEWAGTAVLLLRVLSLSFLFTLLRSIPVLLLERTVRFGWVGTIEFAGSVTNYAVSCTAATFGWGMTSLVAGAVLETAMMAFLAFAIQRWRPSLVFDWRTVRPILHFGLNFQGVHVIGFINHAVTPLLVGLGAGPAALGLVNFARSTAEVPTEVIGIVRRVAFPYFSRLQCRPQAMVLEFDRAVAVSAIPTYFFLALFWVAAPQIVTVLYGEKWLPAVGALQIFSGALALNFFSWIAGAALEAVGAVRVLFRITVLTTVTAWLASALAMYIEPSPASFALGWGVQIPIGVILLYLSLRRHGLTVRPLRAARLPMIAAGVVIGLGTMVADHRLSTPIGLVAFVVFAALVFGVVLLTFDAGLRNLVVGALCRRFGFGDAHENAHELSPVPPPPVRE